MNNSFYKPNQKQTQTEVYDTDVEEDIEVVEEGKKSKYFSFFLFMIAGAISYQIVTTWFNVWNILEIISLVSVLSFAIVKLKE